MEAGDWIAVTALVISVGSVLIGWYFARKERRDRATEIDLLRRQVEGEADARDDQRRARISAEQGRSEGGDRADRFLITVTNLGPAVVRDVDLKVRKLSLEHEDLTPRVQVAPAMLVGERRDVWVEIPRPASRERNLVLWGRWRDDVDDHEEALTPIRPVL